MNHSKHSGYRFLTGSLVTVGLVACSAASAFAQPSAGMAGGAMSKPGCCSEMMGKMPPAAMPRSGGMAMPAAAAKTPALPGFPGDAHIYHVGATGFFLDHTDSITLDATQTAALTRIKDKAMADKAATQKKIDQAEQNLWQLTASDRPESTQIDDKMHELEKLSGDQRIAFIRAVGSAAAVLTPGQRAALLGRPVSDMPSTAAPASTPAPMKGMADPASGQSPSAMGGIGGDSMGDKPMSTPMGKDKMKSMQKGKKMPNKPMPMKHDMPMGDGHM